MALAYPISDAMVKAARLFDSLWRRTNAMAAIQELQNTLGKPGQINHFVSGNLGHDAGAGSDGVLLGALTLTNLTKCLVSGRAQAVLCIADDGGVYTPETTDANDADADDVQCVPTAGAEDDALYIGHATKQFDEVRITISTQGNFVGAVTWEYWDGDSWAELDDVVDGTSNFSAAAATVAVTFTLPEDWDVTNVDSVSGYWIRARLSTATSGGGVLAGRLYVLAVAGSETWTDETADAGDADVGDVALFPTYAVVDDAVYFGGGTSKFFKLAMAISTAMTGTLTTVWEYWTGAAWASIATLEDASASSGAFKAGTSTYYLSFLPPADWTANTALNGPNAQTGFFIRCRLSAITSYTAQPLATTVKLKKAAGSGLRLKDACTLTAVQGNAQTLSGSTGDSVFLLVNVTAGTFDDFTWTKATQSLDATVDLDVTAEDEIAIVQVAEDTSTEFANVNFAIETEAAA